MNNVFFQFTPQIIRIKNELITNLELLKNPEFRDLFFNSITREFDKEIYSYQKSIQLKEEKIKITKNYIVDIKNKLKEANLKFEVIKSQNYPKNIEQLELLNTEVVIKGCYDELSKQNKYLSQTGKELNQSKKELKYATTAKKQIFDELLIFNEVVDDIMPLIDGVIRFIEGYKYEVSFLIAFSIEYFYSKSSKDKTLFEKVFDLMFKRIAINKISLPKIEATLRKKNIHEIENPDKILLSFKPLLTTNQNDNYFDFILFLTIRQTVPHELKNLLNYQNHLYQGDFKNYLETYLPIHKNLIGFNHENIIKKWLTEKSLKPKATNEPKTLVAGLKESLEPKTNEPKTLESGLNSIKIKQVLEKRLEFLKGKNLNNDTIMEEDVYEKLYEKVVYLIKNDSLPKNDDNVFSPYLSKGAIKHTFYLIHKDLFGTTKIRDSFIEFLHTYFTIFSNTTKSTTKTKFSIKPKKYPF